MSTLSRRTFLKGVAALGAGAVLYQYSDGSYRIAFANAGPAVYEMRIVHTNDHHARIEPAPDITLSSSPAATRNLGGVARRKTLFDGIKTANPAQDILFLDAGDIFQGTLYFNLYSGQADLYFYNNLGYHAVAVGNHEFDKGDQTLANFIAGAQFPMLSANVGVSGGPLQPLKVTGTATANGKLGDATIVTLPSGKKVGIFGLTPPDTGLLSSPSANITFGQDLVAIAQAQVDALKAAGADLIVGLHHVGYLVDLDLAAKVKGINVIVGGHSHTPLIPDSQSSWPMGTTRVAAYPQIVADPDGNNTVVVQDWEWAKWVGNIVVAFDAQGKVASVTSSAVEPVWADGIKPAGRTLLPDEGVEIVADAAFQTKIDTDFKPGVDALANQKFAETEVLLDGARPNVRSIETNLSDLITDALRDLILIRPAFNPQNLPVVCITNGGGIRASIAVGNVTVGGAISVLPFGNTVATVIVTGAGLKAALENGVSQVETGGGRFPQVSGIRYLWNQFAPAGSRLFKIEVAKEIDTRSRLATEFEPLDLEANYLVVTNNFMLTGGDGYAPFTPAGGGTGQLDTGLLMVDVVQNYIKDIWPFENRTQTYVPIDQGTDGRIQRTQSWMPVVTKPAEFVD